MSITHTSQWQTTVGIFFVNSFFCFTLIAIRHNRHICQMTAKCWRIYFLEMFNVCLSLIPFSLYLDHERDSLGSLPVLYCILLYSTVLYYTLIDGTIFCSTVLYYTLLDGTIFYLPDFFWIFFSYSGLFLNPRILPSQSPTNHPTILLEILGLANLNWIFL